MAWIEYNPNPRRNRVGDCAIRAVAKATDQDWEMAYTGLYVKGYSMGDLPSANSVWGAYLRDRGFKRAIVPNTCPDCFTVERQIERGFSDTNYNLATQNCATLSAIDKVGDRIIDYMANEKMQTLRDENQALRLAASQERQNQFLISQLGYQCPKPAYVVQPPQQVTFPTNCCGGVNYAGYNNGCGCGCGCN